MRSTKEESGFFSRAVLVQLEKNKEIKEVNTNSSRTIKTYLAPMEGITTYVYRNAQAAVYGRLDKYFTPFLEPHEKRSFKKRELQEILPENNRGIPVVPQILTNRAEGFLELAGTLQDFGYQEINLNLGCPSRTVVSKGKGSGFLAVPEELDRFLDKIFSGLEKRQTAKETLGISVKTRLGMESPEEFPRLLDIFNQYPLKELIVHPRVQKDYYNNRPNRDMYRLAEQKSKTSVCYNGDLFTYKDVEEFCREFPKTQTIMLGRGLIRNPGLLAGEMTEQEKKARFRQFHELVLEGYRKQEMGDRNVLFKMKELWFYQIQEFPGAEKAGKRIKKAQTLAEYETAVLEIWG